MKYIESYIQQECLKYFKYQYPEFKYEYIDEKKRAHLCCLLVKNCNEGDKSDTKRMIEFAEGLTPGVADMSLKAPSWDHKYHGLEIEFKKPGGKQTQSQLAYEKHVTRTGYKYILIDSFDKFKKELKTYLNK
jgi:hypothetical protein